MAVASQTKLPFYSMLHFFFNHLFHFAFSTPAAVACLSFLEVLICHVGGFLQGWDERTCLCWNELYVWGARRVLVLEQLLLMSLRFL